MKTHTPDFKRIFSDIIALKYPEKKYICKKILSKKNLTALDVLLLNKIIFEKLHLPPAKNTHKSYHINDIKHILAYQKKHKLNNSQLAKHFKLSRNTVTKWKKMLLV